MANRSYTFDPQSHRNTLLGVLREVVEIAAVAPPGPLLQSSLHGVLRRYPKDGKGFFSRSELIAGYRALVGEPGLTLPVDEFAGRLRLRPVRTHSGVTPITVLSKPFPCPGECVFCPNDVRMPKSYLSDEPGCQRAEQNGFDPYLQTYNRMSALAAIGHSVAKIELIVLGGTWSFYPKAYQRWFIKRCFDAINDFAAGADERDIATAQRFDVAERGARAHGRGAGQYNKHVDRQLRVLSGAGQLRHFESSNWQDLQHVQSINEAATSRCVGLVLETRPDYVTVEELVRFRRLGCTKVQIGYQSLSDTVLGLNKRGHDAQATRNAMGLLRDMGFKVLAHMMPNLLGATPESDMQEIRTVFEDTDFRPDEMKVYPCSLIETAELMEFYERGQWAPYSEPELLEVLCEVIGATPPYCRLSRVIRDICSGDIVAGNKKSNFREYAERALDERGVVRRDIRSREVGLVGSSSVDPKLNVVRYEASGGQELFVELSSQSGQLLGFCRIRLCSRAGLVPELGGGAVIRELHVYGAAQVLGQRTDGQSQHRGLGTRLLEVAIGEARQAGATSVAVISAVGTRQYYRKKGFVDGELYQHFELD